MNRPGVRLAACLLLIAVSLPAQTLPELFHKAKAQVKGEAWQDALKTLAQLDAESAKPGNENARAQLAAPLSFYRAVCEANLGMAEEARADFGAFLALQPNASMDPSMYSKKAIAAFRSAQESVRPADGDDEINPRCSPRSRSSSCRPTPASGPTGAGPTDRSAGS